jgi:hypothetical protein
MATSRRALLEQLYEQAGKPHEVNPKDAPLAQALNRLKPGEMLKPGMVGAFLHIMDEDTRTRLLNAAEEVLDEEEYGGKGVSRDYILSKHGANHPATHKFVDHVQVEEICLELQNRRGGDADRPLEPLTQRDWLEASYDAHTGGEETNREN